MEGTVINNSPQISVIIPTYKPGDYIFKCLESIKEQTIDKTKFELLVVLNGCFNPWYEKIQQWFIRNSEFDYRLIQTDTPGVSNARNIGINLSRGRYIAFIDDDDFISKSYLEELFIKANDQTIVLSDSILINDLTGKENHNYDIHTAFLRIKGEKKISLTQARSILNGPCMKLIPKRIIADTRFDTSFKNGEDALFIYEISHKVKNILTTTECAIYYRRIRENSAITVKKSLYTISKNAIRLSFAIFKRWCRMPFSYNTYFTLTRILGPFKGAIYEFMGKY